MISRGVLLTLNRGGAPVELFQIYPVLSTGSVNVRCMVTPPPTTAFDAVLAVLSQRTIEDEIASSIVTKMGRIVELPTTGETI